MAKMTTRSSLRSPYVTLSLGTVLLALVALALVPGLLPPGGNPRPATSLPAPSASPVVSLVPTLGYPTPSPEPTFATYQVHVGDTLTSIAAAFHTTARSIAWWNRGMYPSLDPESPGYRPDDIKVGWTLVLLPGEAVDEENPPSPSPGPPTPEPSPTGTPGPSAT
jgi:hypothetical protein